jgi:GT2 family glycosyltransferase
MTASIVVVAHNHAAYLPACLAALDAAGVRDARIRFVDNASADGSADVVEGLLSGGRTRGGIPCEVRRSAENLGFAGGNNLAVRRALEDGDEWIYFLNPDTRARPGFLDEAIAAARADARIALVQSLVLREGEGEGEAQRINTFGNAFHYLGFGYAAGDGLEVGSAEAGARLSGVCDVAVASGAAFLARAAALAEIGLFDEELFLYHEDAELSLRARLAGWRVVLAPRSVVGHHYHFSRNPRKLYFLERNRWLVLAWHLRLPTLLAIAPPLVGAELGLWALAWRQGWLAEKKQALAYFLEPGRWREVLASRARVQALRRVSDRALTAPFTGEIRFPAVDSWILREVANPLLSAYWSAVRRAIRW